MWEWREEVNTKHTQGGTATLLSPHSEIKGDKGRYNRERRLTVKGGHGVHMAAVTTVSADRKKLTNTKLRNKAKR